MAEPSVEALLLQEAQEEIGSLRSELYSTRRVAEERRQANESLSKAKDELTALVGQLQEQLAAASSTASKAQQLELKCQHLESSTSSLQKENQLHVQARKILEAELRDERLARQQVEESKARTEGDRSKLQKARDDLAAQLRIAQHRAKEAEEEQCRAEEEAAAARAELATLHAQQSHYSAAEETADTADSGAMSVRLLSEQLEGERVRAASLLGTLTATKAKLDATTAQLEIAKMQLNQAPAAQPQASSSEQQHTQQLQQQVTEQQQQVAALVQQLTVCQQDLGTSQHHLSALKQQLLSLQQQYDDTQQQLTTAQEDLTTTRADLERMRRAATISLSEGGAASGPGMVANGPASTSSFPGSRQQSYANLAALGSEEELRAEVVRLSHKVKALKASRDKLLSELDSHSEDIDQLIVERNALQHELAEIREVAAKWEAQAQDSLLYIDRLKDLLEESAQWQPEAVVQAAGQAAAGEQGSGINGISTQTSSLGSDAPGDMHAALLKEQARCADLEVQVRALCAELTRSHHAQQDIGHSLMPVLSGIESKLLQLHSVTRV